MDEEMKELLSGFKTNMEEFNKSVKAFNEAQNQPPKQEEPPKKEEEPPVAKELDIDVLADKVAEKMLKQFMPEEPEEPVVSPEDELVGKVLERLMGERNPATQRKSKGMTTGKFEHEGDVNKSQAPTVKKEMLAGNIQQGKLTPKSPMEAAEILQKRNKDRGGSLIDQVLGAV
jgi:hypothetical protein